MNAVAGGETVTDMTVIEIGGTEGHMIMVEEDIAEMTIIPGAATTIIDAEMTVTMTIVDSGVIEVLPVTGTMIIVGAGVVREAQSTGTGAAVPPQGGTEVEGVAMIEGVKGITEMRAEVEAVNGITAVGMQGADTSSCKSA